MSDPRDLTTLLRSIDLVAFDCDGVLVDSEIIAQEAELDWIRQMGWDIHLDTFRNRFTGKHTEDILQEAADHLGIPLDPEFVAWARADMNRRMQDVASIPDAADAVHSVPVARAVASNSRRESLLGKIALAGVGDAFDRLIFSVDDVPRGKPAPDLYRAAVEAAGTSAARAIAIEDSVTGLTSAHAAGLAVIGFTGASHQTPEGGQALLQAGALAVAADMKELKALLAPIGRNTAPAA